MTAVCGVIRNESFLHEYPGYGWSSDAREISDYWSRITVESMEPMTLRSRYEHFEEALDKARQESSADNWDGYGAKALDRKSQANAQQFWMMLPMWVPVPDVCVDPDGMVEFEWYGGPQRVFSVTAEAGKGLIYAGLFGRNKIHGMESLTDEIPRVIFESIQRTLQK